MIVNERTGVIYLHNPKSGGTFLRRCYRKQYGKTADTRFWALYTRQVNTDLGHITYNLLPRFLPQWKDYRIMVMLRNPYNRFESGLKESRFQLDKYKRFHGRRLEDLTDHPLQVSLPRLWLMRLKIKELSLFQYDEWAYVKRMIALNDPLEFCETLARESFYHQDLLLRNKRIPWLNPQSQFIGLQVEILHYESEEDWRKLAEAFELDDLMTGLNIQKDYEIPEREKELIRQLYFDDELLFTQYNK